MAQRRTGLFRLAVGLWLSLGGFLVVFFGQAPAVADFGWAGAVMVFSEIRALAIFSGAFWALYGAAVWVASFLGATHALNRRPSR